MNYFDPNGQSISVFDVCEAYQLLEANYNVDGWVRERPSNRRRMESIGCQLARIGYSSGHRQVDLWLDGDEAEAEREICGDDEDVRFVYFKKVLEWRLPIDADDRAVIERIFTVEAIERWDPGYFPMRPWRVAMRTDHDWMDASQPAWRIALPSEHGTTYHCDEEGQTAYFHSYRDATQKAKSLTEEMHARNQGAKVVRVGSSKPAWSPYPFHVFVKIRFDGDRLSITGVEGPKRDGNCHGSCGQIAMHAWEIDAYAPGFTPDTVQRLRDVWQQWHLNDCQAGSPYQTAYLKEHPVEDRLNYYEKACEALADAGLNPDPHYLHNGKMYRYGSAWLKVDVPVDALEFLCSLPDTDITPAWV